MDREADFLVEYRNISSKLKKRFLRKPNVSEASDQFYKLSKRLIKDDEYNYAGFSGLAVVKCEQSNANTPGEIEALIESGRTFMKSEMKVFETGNYSFEYDLAAAVDCYAKAIRLLEETPSPSYSARSLGLCSEIGNSLRQMGKTGQALSFYLHGAKTRSPSQYLLESVHIKEQVAACYIDSGDYHNALTTLTEVSSLIETHGSKKPRSIYLDILSRSEVTRVLLLLLIKPTPQNLSPSLTSILEKYAWDSLDDDPEATTTSYAPEELFLLLQSVVMASQVQDGEALIELEDDLCPHLNEDQSKLLRILVHSTRGKGRLA
eukprot:TRINITY_DN5218_c0_g1_i2.p1 TRINITY_DN5218_c0_g1~~TRINITY_DN5218_c0_g1_i2.p1  ORF type:complete len:320 (+),score=55.29 TRINITY_DN5218_c0_g1_i2:304-1263(+)